MTRGPPPDPLKGRTALVTGSTRGIGRAIALRLGQAGANVVVTGKTDTPHPKLPHTIHSTARDVEDAGGRAMALQLDVRHEEQITEAVHRTEAGFGGLDFVVHNAGAIDLRGIDSLPAKRFDLMHAVNVRAMYLVTRSAVPPLRRSGSAHVLALAPPLDVGTKWFSRHLGYTLSKYGMSLCVRGLAEELRADGIAVNALWPRTLIGTAAVEFVLGGAELLKRTRHPSIVADAAVHVLSAPAARCTGKFMLDEEVLREAGVTDLERYAVDPSQTLANDLFID